MAITSDPPDLLSVGRHCAFPECHQLDFLPFECKDCRQSFCQEHRSATAHKCSAPRREPDALVCPLCALAIRPRQGEDPNQAFQR